MRMSDGEIIGFVLLALGLLAQCCETWYYGWNILPGSVNELIADTVCATAWIIGLILMMVAGWMR